MRIRLFIGILSAVFLSGCANTAEYLRSQPVAHYPALSEIKVPGDLDGLISVHCMKELKLLVDLNGMDHSQCLYTSVNVSNLTSKIKKDDEPLVRDKAISYLTSISDLNCSNFLHRAFAQKSSMDFSNGLIGDLATGASAGIAHINPSVSSALGVGNLIVGKGVESFNSTYYFDKTFQAMEAAIQSERTKIRAYIFARQANAEKNPDAQYDLLDVLSDVRRYDDACSIKAGLAQLVKLADQSNSLEQQNKIEVMMLDNPEEKILEYQGSPK